MTTANDMAAGPAHVTDEAENDRISAWIKSKAGEIEIDGAENGEAQGVDPGDVQETSEPTDDGGMNEFAEQMRKDRTMIAEKHNQGGTALVPVSATAMAFYRKMPDPMVAIDKLGTDIAKSQIFGNITEATGRVIAMECLAEGMTPCRLALRYHIIEAKLSMRADAMLGRFRELGGRHKILERTADNASVELSFEGQTIVESFSWEEAQAEPYPWTVDKKGNRVLKKNWGSPRTRRQMLWARVVSEGIRPLAPEVINGRYTPEEIVDTDDKDIELDDNGDRIAASVNGSVRSQKQAAAPPAQDDVIDADYEVTGTTANATPDADADEPLEGDSTTATAAVDPPGDFCSAVQSSRIKELWGLLGTSTEDRDATLKRRNAQATRNLTAAQATEIITALEKKLAKRQTAEADPSKPCGPELAKEICEQFKIVNQQIPGIAKRYSERMKACGLTSTEQLTLGDACGLLDALKSPTQLEQYLFSSFWPTPGAYSPKESEEEIPF